MESLAATAATTETEFAALIDALAAEPDRREQLTDLLREDHALYDQRGTAATVRMRGWILLAFARVGVSDAALVFVLEELDTGADAYLVAAAARALRSYPRPAAAFAPFVMRAIANIRYRDDPVAFTHYGEYAVGSTGSSPVRELLATLAWLGPHARGVLDQVEALHAQRGRLSRRLRGDVDRAVAALRGSDGSEPAPADTCCTLPAGLGHAFSWALGARRGCEPIAATVFEDHDGASVTFNDFFHGHPSIVVFFYTRCDNPLKCSLTVTKLGRIHALLEAQGLSDRIHTAAITYDPAFDLPDRLRGYGAARGLRLDPRHRVLRAIVGVSEVRAHFRLGVNFVESLVNRHRVEVYVLDTAGRVAASFARLHWDEQQVVDRAVALVNEKPDPPARRPTTAPILGTLASLGVAFFPKCPVCWATYLSVFGIAGLEQIPYAPWLQPVLVAVLLINLATTWMRARSTGRMTGFCLASAGALAILASQTALEWASAGVWGVALTMAGSLVSALATENGRALSFGRLTTRA